MQQFAPTAIQKYLFIRQLPFENIDLRQSSRKIVVVAIRGLD